MKKFGEVLILVFLLTECSEDNLVNEERAISIALEDIQDYRPNQSGFKVYNTEKREMKIRNVGRTYESWVIIIDSEQGTTLYQIDVENGEILDKGNYLKAFQD